jgi:hypothetical protein
MKNADEVRVLDDMKYAYGLVGVLDAEFIDPRTDTRHGTIQWHPRQ